MSRVAISLIFTDREPKVILLLVFVCPQCIPAFNWTECVWTGRGVDGDAHTLSPRSVYILLQCILVFIIYGKWPLLSQFEIENLH